MNTYNYLKATADSIANRWHQGLKDLQDISDPASISMHIDHLQELYQEANELYDLYSQSLHPLVLGKLSHIASSDFDRHINLSKKIINSK